MVSARTQGFSSMICFERAPNCLMIFLVVKGPSPNLPSQATSSACPAFEAQASAMATAFSRGIARARASASPTTCSSSSPKASASLFAVAWPTPFTLDWRSHPTMPLAPFGSTGVITVARKVCCPR